MMFQFIKDLFNKPSIKEKPPYYSIVCPYCFEKFEPNDVVFRAAHSKEDHQDYALQEDEKLNKYREKFNLSPIDEIEAIIHPQSIPQENLIISENVLVGLQDNYGIVTRKRLCPSCHNELPVPSGKVPSNIISIVGATASGKSVYIASLIHTLQHTTSTNFAASCIPLNAEMSRRYRQQYEEPVFDRGSMIPSTQKEVMQEPLIFQFKFINDEIPPITLVFFDVAGEGMVDESYIELYASHIKNSSGIIFMVDPLQIRSIRDRLLLNFGNSSEEFAGKYDDSQEIIVTLNSTFIAHLDKGVTDIPTAIVVAKSDMLELLKEEDGQYIGTNSNVFNNVVHNKVFNLDEFNNINGEIARFIEKVDRPFKNAVDAYFKKTAFFAVSSLGANPADKQLTGVVNPIRVDEPFLWLLYEFGYIEGSRS